MHYDRRGYLKAVGGLVAGASLAGCSQGDDSTPTDGGNATTAGGGGNDPVNLSIASFREGTAWYVIASAIANNAVDYLPDGSQIDSRPIGGGIGTARLVAQGEVDLGLGVPTSAAWAREGDHVPFSEDDKSPGLRAIMGHLDTYWLAHAVAADVPVDSVGQLIDEQYPIKLGIAEAGSFAAYGVIHGFEAMGVSFEDIESWGGRVNRMPVPDMRGAMETGDVNMLGQMMTPSHPMWTQMANNMDIKLLPVPDTYRQTLLDHDWFDMPPIPAGSYGIEEDTPAIGMRSILMTMQDLDDYVASALAEAMIDTEEQLKEAAAPMSAYDPEKGVMEEWLAIPLHDAAASYYEDAGLR